jgi:hypothetical protein
MLLIDHVLHDGAGWDWVGSRKNTPSVAAPKAAPPSGGGQTLAPPAAPPAAPTTAPPAAPTLVPTLAPHALRPI